MSAIAHVGGRLWDQLLRACEWLLTRVRPHRGPLALILLACGLGQAAVLVQTPLVSPWPQDSSQYLAVAHHILTSQSIFDPLRTPGYPLLLAAIFLVTGGQHLEAVVLVQAGLLVLATVEVYVLASRIGAPRWLATVLGILQGINPLVLTYERTILTEALAYWLVVTIALTFERLLRRPRRRTLVIFALLSVAAVLTRPNLIYLPALLLLILTIYALRLRELRRRGRGLALALALAYAPVLAYMAGNAITLHYFGLSYLTNATLFEKVIEYRMYDLPFTSNDPQVLQLHSELRTYAQAGVGLTWWKFQMRYPDARRGSWAVLRELAVAEIEQHPLYYLEHSIPDMVACDYAPPIWYAPTPYMPLWVSILVAFFGFVFRVYYFLPLLVVPAAVRAWRHPRQVSQVVACALVIVLVSHIVITGLVDFTEFWRLRFPVDWAMTLVFALALAELVPASARALARLRSRPLPANPARQVT